MKAIETKNPTNKDIHFFVMTQRNNDSKVGSHFHSQKKHKKAGFFKGNFFMVMELLEIGGLYRAIKDSCSNFILMKNGGRSRIGEM